MKRGTQLLHGSVEKDSETLLYVSYNKNLLQLLQLQKADIFKIRIAIRKAREGCCRCLTRAQPYKTISRSYLVPIVNFINVKRTNFSEAFSSYIHVDKRLSYKKLVRKMLMKLTPSIS